MENEIGYGKIFSIAFFTSLFVSVGVYLIFLYIFPNLTQKQTVQIPDLRGVNVVQAESILHTLGLTVKLGPEIEVDNTPAAVVLKTNPAVGTVVARKSEVVLTISKGVKEVTVLDVSNVSEKEATEQLTLSGLTVSEVVNESSERVRSGRAIRTIPSAMTKLKKGDTIKLFVSSGKKVAKPPDVVFVPGLVNKTVDQAKLIIFQQSLTLGGITETTDPEYEFGVVIKQYPAAGKKVLKGSPVGLVINVESGE